MGNPIFQKLKTACDLNRELGKLVGAKKGKIVPLSEKKKKKKEFKSTNIYEALGAALDESSS